MIERHHPGEHDTSSRAPGELPLAWNGTTKAEPPDAVKDHATILSQVPSPNTRHLDILGHLLREARTADKLMKLAALDAMVIAAKTARNIALLEAIEAGHTYNKLAPFLNLPGKQAVYRLVKQIRNT